MISRASPASKESQSAVNNQSPAASRAVSQAALIDTAPLPESTLVRITPIINRPSVVLRAWTIEHDPHGMPTKMKDLLRSRKGKKRKLFEVEIDSVGRPIQGFFTMDGKRIECTPEDIDTMWYNFRGVRALWNYYSDHHMLDSISPSRETIPDSLFGKPVRIIQKNGLVFMGVLEKPGNGRSNDVVLLISNSRVLFSLLIVRVIEQIRKLY
jgi:hypothetical protein